MPLPQSIPISITPENVWAVLDDVESDFEDDLADVMEDLDTEFVFEDEQKNEDKDENQEADTSISDANQSLHTIVHDSIKITTLTFKMKISMSPVMLWTVLLKAKMIP